MLGSILFLTLAVEPTAIASRLSVDHAYLRSMQLKREIELGGSVVQISKSASELATVARAVKVARSERRGEESLRLATLDIAESTLSTLIVRIHRDAQKTRSPSLRHLTESLYRDYLAIFPNAHSAYDLRFYFAELLFELDEYEEAAQEYTRVLLQEVAHFEAAAPGVPPTPGRWAAVAAFNAVVAWDRVSKPQEKLNGFDFSAGEELSIPQHKQELLNAGERYLRYFPEGGSVVEVMYKVGSTYYNYNHLEQAVAFLSRVALQFPDAHDSIGLAAANRVLDCYNLQRDYKKMIEWARRFLSEPRLLKDDFEAELRTLIENSEFKLISDAASADRFVSEFRTGRLVSKALLRAAEASKSAGEESRAQEYLQRLTTDFPESSEFPKAMYALAESFEENGDLQGAAERFESYAERFIRQDPTLARWVGVSQLLPQGSRFEESSAREGLKRAERLRNKLGHTSQALFDRNRRHRVWSPRRFPD